MDRLQGDSRSGPSQAAWASTTGAPSPRSSLLRRRSARIRFRATRPSRSNSSGRSSGTAQQPTGNRQPRSADQTQARQLAECFGDTDPAVLHGHAVYRERSASSRRPGLVDPSFQMGVTWSHGISELGQFTSWFELGVYLVIDINSGKLLTFAVNSGDNETPLTDDPSVRNRRSDGNSGARSRFDIVTSSRSSSGLTLRFHHADRRGRPDRLGGRHQRLHRQTAKQLDRERCGRSRGHSSGRRSMEAPVTGRFRTDLIGKVVDVICTLGRRRSTWRRDPEGDPRGNLQPAQRGRLHHQGHAARFDQRDGQFLADGGVIASGNAELLPYPNPCTLGGGQRGQRRPQPELHRPGEDLRLSGPCRLAGDAPPGAGEHRPHRGADAGEPVLRPHARLPEPALERAA